MTFPPHLAPPLLAWAPLALYGLFGRLATPVIRRHLRRRCARGREDPARLGERLGRAGADRPRGALIWIHGASVGESLSALPLIETIRRDWPALSILVTTGTVTSAKLMAERLPKEVVHQYLPVDLPAAVAGFLAHWRPALGLIIESELWPNLLGAARARGVELALVNGRISAKSFASWRRYRPLPRHLLGLFSLVLAQSREDQAHLGALGADQPRSLGNLKFAALPLSADPRELAALDDSLGTRPRWLAASTHPGEEDLIARAHLGLAPKHPGLLTLLAPRHPDRGADLAADLRAQGHRVARRAAGEPITPETGIYLADTIGDLGLWYRLAEIVFVGGSLVPKGGQNLLEPAKLDCAILCGPHSSNFRRLGEEMSHSGALRRVTDARDLADAVKDLLSDPPARRAMAAAARTYAADQAGVLTRIVAALAPLLDRAGKTDSGR